MLAAECRHYSAQANRKNEDMVYTQTTDLRAFEAAVSFAQTLTQWAFVIIGGTIGVLLSTSHHRPPQRWVRTSYLLLVPAWILLSLSIKNGLMVQQAYLAALFSQAEATSVSAAMGDDARMQILQMELGLLFLSLWMALYLVWWIFGSIQNSGEANA